MPVIPSPVRRGAAGGGGGGGAGALAVRIWPGHRLLVVVLVPAVLLRADAKLG